MIVGDAGPADLTTHMAPEVKMPVIPKLEELAQATEKAGPERAFFFAEKATSETAPPKSLTSRSALKFLASLGSQDATLRSLMLNQQAMASSGLFANQMMASSARLVRDERQFPW